MRPFELVRLQDVTGVSGTGVVAEGAMFSDGTVAVRWLATATSREHAGVRPTTVLHDDIWSVVALHGHGASTVVRFTDGAILTQADLAARRSAAS